MGAQCMLMVAEGFADKAFDGITLHRILRILA